MKSDLERPEKLTRLNKVFADDLRFCIILGFTEIQERENKS